MTGNTEDTDNKTTLMTPADTQNFLKILATIQLTYVRVVETLLLNCPLKSKLQILVLMSPAKKDDFSETR